MSTSDPIAPDRLEALLRGEAGADGRERRIGALLDELTVGEIVPPAELRERVRSPAAAPAQTPPAARRLPRLRRPAIRLVPLLGLVATVAVVAGVLVMQNRTPSTVSNPNLRAGQTTSTPHGDALHVFSTAQRPLGAVQTVAAVATAKTASPAPGPDGQRAQDYAASLRLAVGSVADLSRSTQAVLDTVDSLGGAVESVDYGTPSAGNGSALIDLRIPVGRSQEALRRFSALGAITSQQVQIRDLQAGLDQGSNRARALRHRIALLAAKLLSPTLTAMDRATLESRLADSRTGLESVLRGIHATQQRAAFARFSLDLVTGSGSAVAPAPSTGAFERTADDALGVISVAGRGSLFAAIVGGPFLLVAACGWWLARRLRRRAARRLLESS